ncbi:methyltransferase domain-containing protein [Rhodococcus sp. D2-41]|uniref:Class I SAM-dependent methyltransferase n=1 Tax=Speluncibacter jeojiensis TaxID=2710754 RepID=A0A9X4M5P3_9ACTN|nr:class I SAM-dependent methyltransferase [Rhodococcus sp. D2-41]MDG3009508.1 methyltransferase domain-containing protein [Rhodococcus sp. D2-41]MDG3016437.1 class I SAM-dependent methyltransferase [Corynebacteriales bacterium D3-21]
MNTTTPTTPGKMSLAEIIDVLTRGEMPLRFTAYDGSSTGPDDAPYGLDLKTPRGATYIATAPGDLGMARAYVSGDLDITGVHPGDPYELFKVLSEDMHLHRPPAMTVASIMRSLGWERLRPIAPPPQETLPRWRRVAEGLRHSKTRDAESIHHHYDVSNAFYEKVLGPSMTYTCAAYPTADSTLEEAQEAKYQLVFDKLGLESGMRLLDVGCGWGGMVRFAARRGVKVIGATLSREQAEWAQKAIADEGLSELAEVRFSDYRDVPERGFDCISSIGMTEHIGVANYPSYFATLFDRLRPGGRLLNHCITRPDNHAKVKAGAFIDRYVFPDGELTGSGRIITEMQNIGFDVRHEENLREHYALTLRDWCRNLVENWDFCVNEVGEGTARVWGLYMAGSRLGFERNGIQLHQVLAVKPGEDGDAQVPLRPWWSR